MQGLKTGADRPRRRRRGRQGDEGGARRAPASRSRLSIKKENQSRITTDSRASIGSMSLLGEPLIDISPSSAGTPLKDGDTHHSRRSRRCSSPTSRTRPTKAIVEATALLKDIRAGKGTVGKLFTDDTALPRAERVRRVGQRGHRVDQPAARARSAS